MQDRGERERERDGVRKRERQGVREREQQKWNETTVMHVSPCSLVPFLLHAPGL